ncbi:MAG: signal recognition particle-docking protein FtsY [Anaerolineales bacterium]|nr:signal recognition particle-docking protein FtsY [Anaerolineales bacterium]
MFSLFRRPQQIKTSLTKTRASFLSRLTALVAKNEVNEEFWSGLEETLIGADVGVETTIGLVDKLRARAEKEGVREATRVQEMLKEELAAILEVPNLKTPNTKHQTPITVLVVGVNGSGKTTSIAKLTNYYKAQDKKVVLAAADTFRAAAIDQLKIWGQRVGVDVVAHQPDADPGAVAFDAWQAAHARRADYLVVDTAGRLQTKFNLMKELEKIARVLQKNDATAPHETFLVLDAVTGQNGLQQAREFKKATPLTGLILTKLDGTAKGGIVFAIAKELQVPIKFIGTGEALDDFAEFDAKEFVEGLFE